MRAISTVFFILFLTISSSYASCHFELNEAMQALKMANSSALIKRQLKLCDTKNLLSIKQRLKNNLKNMMTDLPVDAQVRKAQRYQFQANYYLLSLINHQLD